MSIRRKLSAIKYVIEANSLHCTVKEKADEKS